MAIRKPLIIVGDHLIEITAPDTIDPAVLPVSTGAGRTFAYFMS